MRLPVWPRDEFSKLLVNNNYMKKLFAALLIGASLAWLATAALPARAIGSLIDANILAETDCVQKGDTTCEYSVSTFMRVGINVANIILGLVGALALVVFIYGGVRMLTSGGNAESVTAGKKSIMGAVVGIVLVFGSYTIITFAINKLLVPKSGYQFNGQLDAGDSVVGKADCTAAAPGGKDGDCVKSAAECTDGVTSTATECKGNTPVCCAKKLGCLQASSEYRCVVRLQDQQCDSGYKITDKNLPCPTAGQICVTCVQQKNCTEVNPEFVCKDLPIVQDCGQGMTRVNNNNYCSNNQVCTNCQSNLPNGN